MKAYVFLQVLPATQGKVLDELENKKENNKFLKDFDALYGTFDILVSVNGEEKDVMKTLAELGKINGVTSTNTFVAANRDLAREHWK